MFHSSGRLRKHGCNRRNRVSVLFTATYVSTSGFDVAMLNLSPANVDPQHSDMFALTNYTKLRRYSEFVSTSQYVYTARLRYLRFHGRHLDFRQNDTVDFVGDDTIKKPTPENVKRRGIG